MSDIEKQLEEKIRDGKKYKVIYSDPPWSFLTRSDKGKEKSADKHYGTMSIEDIKNLPVNGIADDDAVLFLWVTDPLLPQCLEVIKAWGFEYKTVGFTWRKLTKHGKEFMGLGYYTRSNPEMCLIATKGKPPRVKNRGVRQMVNSLVREHSRKPDEIYDLIELLYDGPYLELFSRTTRAGWDALGNEVGKF